MKEDNKKVIMVDGKNSEWYEKAIFIMRSDTNTQPIDLINEAEKIINSYMIKTSNTINEIKTKTRPVSNDKKLNTILNFCLVLSIILLGITIYRLCI